MTTSKPIKGGKGVGSLLHRMQMLVDGVARHKGDPGFDASLVPAAADLQRGYDALSTKVETATADHAIAQKSHGVYLAERTIEAVAYTKAVYKVRGLYGETDPVLRDFGITPISRNKGKRLKKSAKAAAAPASHAAGTTPTSTPPSTSSPTGASPAGGTGGGTSGAPPAAALH